MFNNFITQHYNLDNITIKDKLIQSGGSNSNYNNYIISITSIIIIIVSVLIYNIEEVEVIGEIIKIDCNRKNCYIKIKYNVENKEYEKSINTDKVNNYKVGTKIRIYLNKNNPIFITLHKIDYKFISLITATIGIILLVKNQV